MAESPQTFSESWYRVANQRIGLRPSIAVRRQRYRGERWIVLENPFSNQFFRLRPEAYEFVGRLDPNRTVEEVWRECLERFPDTAPGQESVIQLLAQLYHANLLQYSVASDTAQLFKRFERTRQRETRARLLNVMFMRFPLLDPDQFLLRTLPVVGKLISPIGALLWMLVVAGGIKVAVDHFGELADQSQGILAPGNLFLLYAGLIVVKTLHEFGHAYFCRKFGGQVHVMGVMLMIFTPIPYMDATSSWGFRERWKRVLVGSAGMIVEVFVAALAAFAWAYTGPGVVHSLAYNMMFVASVSTVLFNINPLLRFDGYYILSDLLEIPNLHQQAQRHIRYLFERYLLGVRKSETPARTGREKFWLTTFGILSTIYRLFIAGVILLFVADRFLILGIIMAVFCVVSWIVAPLVKFTHYLLTSPQLARCRPRAIAVAAGGIALILGALQFLPLPSHFRAPGVLKSREWSAVRNETAGYVREFVAQPGARVMAGDPLVRIGNPELAIEIAAARAGVEEVQARLREAMQQDGVNWRPLQSRLELAQTRLNQLLEDESRLVIRARHDGTWVAPRHHDFEGRWLTRGTEIGLVIDPSRFEFIATVAQEDGDRLFAGSKPQSEVRLHGESGKLIDVEALQVIPAEKRQLPSAALGWAGGGEVAVRTDDPEGRLAAEPFFEVRAEVAGKDDIEFLHGRSGRIRFELEPEPLLPRGIRRLRQLLQKRYQL